MSEEQKAHYLSRVTTKSPFTPAPKTRKEMLKNPFVNEYVMAEKEEVANLGSLGTFEIARRSGLPKQAKTLKCKWVYADKLDRDGSIVKLKARLTAMGCFQREGIDYHETFASVARTKTFRVLMSIYNSNASYTCQHWTSRTLLSTPQMKKKSGSNSQTAMNWPIFPETNLSYASEKPFTGPNKLPERGSNT